MVTHAVNDAWTAAKELYRRAVGQVGEVSTQLLDGEHAADEERAQPSTVLKACVGVCVMIAVVLLIKWFVPMLIWVVIGCVCIGGILMVYQKQAVDSRAANYDRAPAEWA